MDSLKCLNCCFNNNINSFSRILLNTQVYYRYCTEMCKLCDHYFLSQVLNNLVAFLCVFLWKTFLWHTDLEKKKNAVFQFWINRRETPKMPPSLCLLPTLPTCFHLTSPFPHKLYYFKMSQGLMCLVKLKAYLSLIKGNYIPSYKAPQSGH